MIGSELPTDVVTLTLTVPVGRAGETAVICVAPFTVNDAAGVEPNRTLVAPLSPVPLIVTVVPPASGPEFGSTFEMPSGATNNQAAPFHHRRTCR